MIFKTTTGNCQVNPKEVSGVQIINRTGLRITTRNKKVQNLSFSTPDRATDAGHQILNHMRHDLRTEAGRLSFAQTEIAPPVTQKKADAFNSIYKELVEEQHVPPYQARQQAAEAVKHID